MQPETAPETAPEAALNSWREWTGDLRTRPVIRGPLNRGRSNRSFLLDSEQGKLVLRLNGPDALLPDAGRHKETVIWRMASSKGIAPPLLYADENSRFLVSRYIDNSLPSQPPFDQTYTDLAFELLRCCHQLEVEAPGINYADHIEGYWQSIEARGLLSNRSLLEQRAPMQAMLGELIASNTPTGLCHHDPVIANFVGNSKRLYLIDWEYAARGMLIMDFVALAVEWGIDDTTVFEHTGIESKPFSLAKSLYKYLCDLWIELNL